MKKSKRKLGPCVKMNQYCCQHIHDFQNRLNCFVTSFTVFGTWTDFFRASPVSPQSHKVPDDFFQKILWLNSVATLKIKKEPESYPNI